jgi:hypothetical protein
MRSGSGKPSSSIAARSCQRPSASE